MARIHLPQQTAQRTDGVLELELDAPDYRSMMAELEARWPGLRAAIEEDMAVVIDGDIIDTPMLEPLQPDSEVHFMARLGGG